MKKLEIIIRAAKFEEVKAKLGELDINFLTFSDVKAFGKHRERTYRGQTYDDDIIRRVKLEIVVATEKMDEVIATIMNTARTGEIGDGKIVVYDVAKVYRIRTGESDSAAI